MAFGCCDTGITNPKPNYYLGRTALQEHDYFKSFLFKNKNPITIANDSSLMRKLKVARANTPNYIYDVSVSDSVLAFAGGDTGVYFYNIKNLENITAIKNESRAQEFNDTKIKGKNSANGEFFIGDTNGSRYGFEKKFFSGNYSVCNLENIFFMASESDGRSSSIIAFDPINDNKYTLGVKVPGIITAMAADKENLYIGTSGYDLPKLNYGSNISKWSDSQPEYSDSSTSGVGYDNQSSKYFKSRSGGDFYIFDIESLIEEEAELLAHRLNPDSGASGTGRTIKISIKKVKQIDFSRSGHINDIKANADNVCIAVGKREDNKTSGKLVHYKREIKLNKSSFSGRITKKFIFNEGDKGYELQSGEEGSITAVAIDGDDVYCAHSNYGIIKNGKKWFSASGFVNPRICRDRDVSCFDYSRFPPLVYSGYIGVRPVLFQDPKKRVERFLCPDVDGTIRKKTEMIDCFPNSIIVTSTSVYLGLWQNGYISVNKITGLLEYHHFGLYIGDQTCQNFVSAFDNPNLYDVNEEYNFSVGKMASNSKAAFIVDSIQYVANGAGPGIYSPIEKEMQGVIQFSGLIKNFKNFSGIAICEEPQPAPTPHT